MGPRKSEVPKKKHVFSVFLAIILKGHPFQIHQPGALQTSNSLRLRVASESRAADPSAARPPDKNPSEVLQRPSELADFRIISKKSFKF